MNNMEILDSIALPPKVGRSKSDGEDRVANDKKQMASFSQEGYL